MQSFAAAAATRSHVLARIERLEKEVAELRAATSIQAVVSSLAPDPYELCKSIPVVIHGAADDFTATFLDANISTSGETADEAFANLRSLIVDMFEMLEQDEANLGDGPAAQLTVLREFIRKPNQHGDSHHERPGVADSQKA